MTADQVVGARTLEADREIEELHKRNSELEQQIKAIKYVPNRALLYQSSMCKCCLNDMYGWLCRQQQALPRDAAMEDITIRNQYLEERIHSLESQLSKESPSVGATLCMTKKHLLTLFMNFTPLISLSRFLSNLFPSPYLYSINDNEGQTSGITISAQFFIKSSFYDF